MKTLFSMNSRKERDYNRKSLKTVFYICKDWKKSYRFTVYTANTWEMRKQEKKCQASEATLFNEFEEQQHMLQLTKA